MCPCSFPRTEPADHFLVDLLCSQIPLGSVVRRRDVLFSEEKEKGIRCFQKIALESPFFFVPRWTLRGEEDVHLVLDGRERSDSPDDPEGILPDVLSRLGHSIQGSSERDGFPEQTLKCIGPFCLKQIDAVLEVPQEMGEAELMPSVGDDHEVGPQPIAHPSGGGEQSSEEGFDDRVPPRWIDVEEGGQRIAEDPELDSLPCDPPARLVTLDRAPAFDLLFESLVGGPRARGHPVHEGDERAGAQGERAEILEVFRKPLVGEVVDFLEVSDQRTEVCSEADAGRNIGRE